MEITFIILIITTILFIYGKYRSDFIAIGSLLALTISGVVTPAEALAGFSNSVVIMIAGLFIVGAGIFNTGLAEQIGNKLIQFGKNSETRLLIIIMLTVGVFSALMSNTGTVAVLLPVVISIAISMKISPTKLLIPLAFASSLGGVLTLIGTPPNLVVSTMLKENDFEPLGFFAFSPIGLIALISGILFMVTIGKKLLPNNTVNKIENNQIHPSKLAGMYKIYPFLQIVKVMDHSPLIGHSLQELQLSNEHGITVISMERKKNNGTFSGLQQTEHVIPKAKTTFQAGDVALILGEPDNMETFIKNNGLKKDQEQVASNTRKYLLSSKFGITEMIISPHSNFLNQTIRELHFRKKYNCSVLAIYRNGKYIQTDACKVKLKNGDALLVHGEWNKIEALAKTSGDIIVVGRIADVAASEVARGKAPIAGLIMLFMLVLMTLEVIEPVITVLIAAFLMVITGCVRSIGDGYQKINWESVILIAAMLPMATALENTGGVKFMSDSVIHLLGNFGAFAVLIGFYVLTATLSQFISNTATAVIFAPIAITTALELDVSPYPFVIAVAVAASMAFATPVASPTNALVMNAGGYRFKDYVKIGVPLQLFLSIILLIFIPIFYPL